MGKLADLHSFSVHPLLPAMYCTSIWESNAIKRSAFVADFHDLSAMRLHSKALKFENSLSHVRSCRFYRRRALVKKLSHCSELEHEETSTRLPPQQSLYTQPYVFLTPFR